MGDTTNEDLTSTVGLLLIGIIAMLLLAVALVVFFVVYQKRLISQQMINQHDREAHQRELLTAAVEVQENERRRIASDLHDDIGSLLSAARLYLRQFDPQASPAENELIKEESLEIISKIIQNTRRITHDLLPAELEKFGLFATAEDLCNCISRSGQLTVHLAVSKPFRFESNKEVALYRVLQELINNTIKHAEASNIEVEYYWKQSSLFFRYLDNGSGFDLGAALKRGGAGLGLRNIESRISIIGGTLHYESAPGKGLAVSIEVPVTPTIVEQKIIDHVR